MSQKNQRISQNTCGPHHIFSTKQHHFTQIPEPIHPVFPDRMRKWIFSHGHIIVKLLPLIFILFGFSSYASADLNCNDLVGSWSSERHDTSLNSDRRTIKALNPDGSYWVKFIHDNGTDITEQEEHGTWTCDGKVLGIKIHKIDDNTVSFYNTFSLLRLNTSFHSMKPIAPNCSTVLGDCSSEIVLEYYRVLN